MIRFLDSCIESYWLSFEVETTNRHQSPRRNTGVLWLTTIKRMRGNNLAFDLHVFSQNSSKLPLNSASEKSAPFFSLSACRSDER